MSSQNVIALCPKHDRQAHYGVDAEELERAFVKGLVEVSFEQ